MANVTVEKNRYTVDALRQWDLNQVLTIYGLSLPSIPEIHFTNNAMDRAIVRQATMSDTGVISVTVPNSLLQKPYKIYVYVCMYDGDSFKSLYEIMIPVEARNQPNDYTIAVDDEEVYSFNALENKIDNALALSIELYDKVNAKYEQTDAKYTEAYNTLVNITTAVNRAESAQAEAENQAIIAGSLANNAEEYYQAAAAEAEKAEATVEQLSPLVSYEPREFEYVGNPVILDNYEDMPMDVIVEGAESESVTLIRCGKNLIPFPYYNTNTTTVNGITYTTNADGSITANGTPTDTTAWSNFSPYTGVYTNPKTMFSLPAGNYKLVCVGENAEWIYPIVYKRLGADNTYEIVASGKSVESIDFTTTEYSSCYYLMIGCRPTYAPSNETLKFMIVSADSTADYEPYQGETYAITSGELVTVSALAGTNVLYTDGDSLTVSGRRDVAQMIDAKIAKQLAAIDYYEEVEF